MVFNQIVVAATAAREALKDKQHEANVVATGGQFYPLIVETFYGLFGENTCLTLISEEIKLHSRVMLI